MTYKDDAILPAVEAEMATRLAKFRGLSKEEEIKILGLSDAQRKMLAAEDKKLKNEFLQTAPDIKNGGVKLHDQYKAYVKMAHDSTHWAPLTPSKNIISFVI